jgi:hypothetical protein
MNQVTSDFKNLFDPGRGIDLSGDLLSLSSHEDDDKSVSDLASTLSSRGFKTTNLTYESKSKYLVHLDSSTLVHLADQNYLRLKYGDAETISHGEVCKSNKCSYYSKSRKKYLPHLIGKNCPCQEIRKLNPDIQEICFHTFLKFGMTEFQVWLPDEKIEPKEVMFCLNHDNILSAKYRWVMKQVTGVTSWEQIKAYSQLISVLRTLYWFRSGEKEKENLLSIELKKYSTKVPIQRLKGIVKSVMLTITGIMTKFILASPSVLPSKERTIATYDLFVEFFLLFSKGEEEKVEENNIYSTYKDLCKNIKLCFHNEDYEKRVSWIRTEVKNKVLEEFLRPFFDEIYNFIIDRYSSGGDDYTQSYAWIVQCATLSQTRNIATLPDCLAYIQDKEYRERITTKLPPPTREEMILCQGFLRRELEDAKIPFKCLSRDQDSKAQTDFAILSKQELDEITKYLISKTEFSVKPTASVDNTVLDGGKIEDARLLLLQIVEDKWEIPIYDLQNGKILKYLPILDRDDKESYLTHLFWASFQCSLNFLITKKMLKGKTIPLGEKKFLFPESFGDAEILHIPEPGKRRNLIKSNSLLAWVLTPIAKMSQAILAKHPDHKIGLQGSAQMWKHILRTSPTEEGTAFLYDEKGKPRDHLVHVFQDWKESTDFLNRIKGIGLLKEFYDYVGMPTFYAIVSMQLVSLSQTLYEKISGSLIRIGTIVTGFMMGLPLTKVILHIMHMCGEGGGSFLAEQIYGYKRIRLKASAIASENPFFKRMKIGTKVPKNLHYM